MYRDDLLFKEEVHKIIGAAMAVHRYFGCGFTEKVYQDALEIELSNRSSSISGKHLSSSNAISPREIISVICVISGRKKQKEYDDLYSTRF